MREDQTVAARRSPYLRLASALPLSIMFLAISSLTNQFSGEAQVAPSSGPVITQEVRLVLLPVTVRDREGHFVSGLRASNFHVYEDGHLQQIAIFRDEDVPVTVGLVVDHSGSMVHWMQAVVDGAVAFVQASNPRDREFVVNFAVTVSFGLPNGVTFTDSLPELEAALSTPSASGRTALFDALAAALRHISTNRASKKALLLISDGGDNASTHSFAAVLRMAKASDVEIYSIGLLDPLSEDQNPKVLTKLSHATGGEAYFPTSPEEVATVCRSIAADIRHQYTLGYDPPNKERGAFRKIRVLVDAPGRAKLSLRTRPGYFLPPDSMDDSSYGQSRASSSDPTY
jgi:Ca-activated chloride channel homolog